MQSLKITATVDEDLSRVLPLESGVGQNEALPASPAARNSTVQISAFLFIQLHFPPVLFNHYVHCEQ